MAFTAPGITRALRLARSGHIDHGGLAPLLIQAFTVLDGFEQAVDMRVSVLPTIHGESAAIRVLDRRMALRRLDNIGFSPADAAGMRRLLNRDQGLVLVTGPTGSGKTSTLYAGLQELNTGELQIITIEDPVEYRLAKVLQIQVQPAINLLNAAGAAARTPGMPAPRRPQRSRPPANRHHHRQHPSRRR